MSRAVVIDTDPGIDDAIAILWACGAPELDLRAVTTVGGNVGLGTVTRNALDLLGLAGHPAPVHAGADRPLARVPQAEVRVHGADGLGGVALPGSGREAEAETAGAALQRLLEAAAPGTLDLLMLGPMTNLAALIRTAPEAAARLRRVIAMGGAVEVAGNVGAGVEFNLGHDPEAASEVLAAVTGLGLDLTLIPLDCTRQLRATRAWAAGLTGARGRLAGALIGAYFDATEGAESRPLHDPCVPLLAVAPGLFGVETRGLTVDLGARPGAVVPGPHPVRVAMSVDAPAARARLAAGLA